MSMYTSIHGVIVCGICFPLMHVDAHTWHAHAFPSSCSVHWWCGLKLCRLATRLRYSQAGVLTFNFNTITIQTANPKSNRSSPDVDSSLANWLMYVWLWTVHTVCSYVREHVCGRVCVHPSLLPSLPPPSLSMHSCCSERLARCVVP